MSRFMLVTPWCQLRWHKHQYQCKANELTHFSCANLSIYIAFSFGYAFIYVNVFFVLKTWFHSSYVWLPKLSSPVFIAAITLCFLLVFSFQTSLLDRWLPWLHRLLQLQWIASPHRSGKWLEAPASIFLDTIWRHDIFLWLGKTFCLSTEQIPWWQSHIDSLRFAASFWFECRSPFTTTER